MEQSKKQTTTMKKKKKKTSNVLQTILGIMAAYVISIH